MNNYKFEDYRDRIFKAIEKKEREGFFGTNKTVLIVDSFAITTLQTDLSGIQSNGRFIPIVMVIDEETAQVYQFALSSLIPEIKLS